MHITIIPIIVLSLTLTIPVAARQRRSPGSPEQTQVSAAISLQVGSGRYAFEGPAACTHAARAGIYDMPASMWSVRQQEGGRSLNLTVWRPKSGGSDMLTLAVRHDSTSHSVSTVKVGDRGTPKGTGSAGFQEAAKGGTFTISAQTADGTQISGTVKCSAFTPAIAEGGN